MSMFNWTGLGRHHAKSELETLDGLAGDDLTPAGDLFEVRKLCQQWGETDDGKCRKAYIKARDAFLDKNRRLKDAAEKDRLDREKQERDDFSEVSANQEEYEAFIKQSNECGTKTERIIFSECVKTDAGYLFNFYAEWTEYLIFKKSGSFTLQIDKNGEARAVEKNIQQR
jgi:hypothetical protein